MDFVIIEGRHCLEMQLEVRISHIEGILNCVFPAKLPALQACLGIQSANRGTKHAITEIG